MTDEEPLPSSTADALEEVAKWLDLGDRAFEVLAKLRNDERLSTMPTTVQQDLHRWAEWLREHPDVDAAMFAVSSLAKEQS